MSTSLPESILYGKVVGHFLRAVGDTSADPDSYPDGTPATGTVTFTPALIVSKEPANNPITAVIRDPITCTIDAEGHLLDPSGNRGVWLVAGVHKVSYNIAGVTLQGHNIEVLVAHTELAPLRLVAQMSSSATLLTVSQYSELSGRIDTLASPTATVTSVNGQTGNVVIDVPTVPVTSVNGQTGDVTITIPEVTPPSLDELTDVSTTGATGGQALVFDGVGWAPGDVATDNAVDSVNGQTGAVVLDATNVGAIPAGDITLIEVLTQAEYDALPVKVTTTLYVIQG